VRTIQSVASTREPYPGDLTGPAEMLRLADEYRQAALLIAGLGRKGDPISRAPFRLTAIHAVELYLNALLLHAGHEPSRLRGLQHDLAARAELSIQFGLSLRKRTAAHLKTLAASREYLITRYSPDLTSSLSQVNRLSATLEEVSTKVRTAIDRKTPPGRRSPAHGLG
jgi:HEPN domain-containing protein